MAYDISQIVSPEALKQVDTLEKKTGKVVAQILKIHEATAKLDSTLAKIDSKNIDKLEQETKKAVTQNEKLKKSTFDLKKLQTDYTKTLVALAKQKERNTRLTKAEIEANKSGSGSYKRLSVELNKNIKAYQMLSQAERENNKIGGKLLRTIKKQDAALKKLDAQTGRNQRNVGNYKSALSGLLSAFGVVGGVMLFANAIKNAFSVMVGFEKQMKKVKAITLATDEQFNELRKSAIELGGTTLFRASEIAGLQKEYAKLGFSVDEILNATEATLQLATATETDLGQAAEIAGNTLRAFGRDASEMNIIIDVMAKSFTTSALDITKWSDSMKYAAPIAKASNISIEKIAAMLATLADAGISGSMAGTSLKRIISEIGDESGNIIEVLDELSNQNITLSEAEQLVGERAKASLLVLLDNADGVERLTDKYNEAKGAAEQMAGIISESTAASIDLLASAWDGLIMSFSGSNGILKDVIDGLTTVVNSITFLVKYGIINPYKEWDEELTKNAKHHYKLKGIIDDIKTKYGTDLKAMKKSVTDWITSYDDADNIIQKAYKDEREARGQLLKWILSQEKAERDKADLEQKLANEEKARKEKIIDLTITGIKKELREIDKKAATLRELGMSEVEVAKWTAAEKLKIAKKSVESNIKYIKNQKDTFDDFYDDLDQADTDYFDTVIENGEKEVEATNEVIQKKEDAKAAARRKELAAEKALAEEIKQMKMQLASEAVNAAFDIYASSIEREQMALDTQRNYELNAAGDDAKKKDDINKKYAKKEAELKTKQAKADKLNALFNIAINTAASIMATLARYPLPAGLPLVILNAAMGAVQLAAVAARPIPKFAKGTRNAPGGIAEVGEAGHELIEQDGLVTYVEKPTIMNLQKGAKVYTKRETDRIFQMAGKDDYYVKQAIDNQTASIVSAIKNKKELHISRGGRRIVERQGNYYKEYLNRKIEL